MSDYEASGGTSRIYEVTEDEHLQIEVHPESYSVIWPTELSEEGVSNTLARLLPHTGQRAIVHTPGQASHENYDLSGLDVEGFLRVFTDRVREPDFVRIDFDDRVLTWESCEFPEQRFNEIGFLARQFDPSYLVALINATGTPSVVAVAEEAINASSDIVERFPYAELYPDEPMLP